MKNRILARGIALLLAVTMITGQVMVANALEGGIVFDPNDGNTVIPIEIPTDGTSPVPDVSPTPSVEPSIVPSIEPSILPSIEPIFTPGDVVLNPDEDKSVVQTSPDLSLLPNVTEQTSYGVMLADEPTSQGGIVVNLYAKRNEVNEGEEFDFTVAVKDTDLNQEPNIKEGDILTLNLPDFLTVEDVEEALRRDWAKHFKDAEYNEDTHTLTLTFKNPSTSDGESAAQVAMEFQITTITDLTGYDGEDSGEISIGIGSKVTESIRIEIGEGVGEGQEEAYLSKVVWGNYLEKDETNHSYVLNDPTMPITYNIPFGVRDDYKDSVTLTDNLGNGNMTLCSSDGTIDAQLSRCVRLTVAGTVLTPDSELDNQIVYNNTALGNITVSHTDGKLTLTCSYPEGYKKSTPATLVNIALRYYVLLTGNADNVRNTVGLNIDDEDEITDHATVRRTRAASLLATKKALKDEKEVTVIDVTNETDVEPTLTFRIVLVQYGTGYSLKDNDEVVYDILDNCFEYAHNVKFSPGAAEIFDLKPDGQKLTIVKRGNDPIPAGTYHIDFDVKVSLEGDNALLPGQTVTNTAGTTVVIRRDAEFTIDKQWANDTEIGGGSDFKLKKGDGSIVASATSKADGKLTMYLSANVLDFGPNTYTLVETVAEDSGHNSVPDIPVVIEKTNQGITIVSVNGIDYNSGDVEIKVENKEDSGRGSLQFKKYDSKGKLLPGGAFHLYYKEPNTNDFILYRQSFTTRDGTVRFDNIPYGEYYVEELTAPNGYVISDPVSQHVFLSKTSAHATILMENEAYDDGKIIIKKVDQDGKGLQGVTFTLNPGGRTAETNEDGIATFDNLVAGPYIIQETLPFGYSGFAGPINVTIDEKGDAQQIITAADGVTAKGKEITINWTNTKEYGSLKVFKYGKDGALEGAKFKLSGNGIEEKIATTDANGIAEFTGLPFGHYTLKETSAPSGYVVSAELSAGIGVTIDSTTEQVAFTNTTKKGSIELVKTGNGNVKLQGAVFGLYADSAATDQLAMNSTGSDGKVTFSNLEAGTYYVKEFAAPTGYKLDSTVYTFVVGEGNEGSEVKWAHIKEISNELKVYKLKLVKKGDEGKLLKDAEFTISGSGITAQTVTTDSKGEAVFENLPYGTYTIRETKAPDGYVPAADVVVTIGNSTTYYDYTEGQFANIPVEITNEHTCLTVSKVDDKNQSALLAGASFKIKTGDKYVVAERRGGVYYFTGTDEDGSTFVTDNEGRFVLEYLPLGEYVLVETGAPEGYIISEKETGFTIAKANESVVVGNTMIRAKLKLTKTDTYGKLLSGVGFTMRTAAGYVSATGGNGAYNYSGLTQQEKATVFMTDAAGVFSIDNLVMGTYYLDEVVYPDGLKPEEDIIIEVTAETHGKTVEQTVVNDLIYGNLEFVKRNSVGENLAGALFKLEFVHGSDYAKNMKPFYALSDADGHVKFADIPYGIYKLTEYLAPAGYMLSNEVRYVNIGNVKVPDGIEITEKPENDWVNYSIVKEFSVKKISAADGQELSGAVFKILDAEQESLDDEYLLTVNNNGVSNEVTLPLGKYYLKEIKAPVNYILDETLIPFEVTENGENVVIVKNAPYTGSLSIQKHDAEDESKKLAGAEFAVYKRSDYDANGINAEELYTLVTNSSGFAKLDNIPCGDYAVVEIFAPYGYELNQKPQYFSISGEKDEMLQASLTFANEATRYMIRIIKTDNLNARLPGATFSVAGYGFYQEVTTGAEGYVDIEVPAAGAYQIRELVPPVGYTLDPEPYLLEVTSPTPLGIVPTAAFTSENFKTKVILEKVDEKGEQLEGAVFVLYAVTDEGEKPVELRKEKDDAYTYVSVGKKTEIEVGKATITGLPVGNYLLREIEVPEGYTSLGDIRFTLNADIYDEALNITAENILHRKGVAVIKEDANGIRLKGAEFALYSAGEAVPLETKVTTASGYAFFTELTPGDYIIRETAAPAGYKLVENEYEFSIDADGVFASEQYYHQFGTEDDPIFVFTVVNEPIEHGFRIRKVSSMDTSRLLAGAQFRVIGNGFDRVYTTDESGVTEEIVLPVGEYTIAECKAPSGYIMSMDGHHVKIAADGVYVDGEKLDGEVCFTVENRPENFRLKLIKLDERTKKPLSNAAFVVTGEDGSKNYMITDANGVAAPVELQPGTYALSETIAANGYQLPLKGWSFTVEEGSELRVTAVDGVPFTFEDGVLTLTLTNERTMGNLRIHKYDAEDSSPLAGAVFVVKDNEGNPLTFTEENGIYGVDSAGKEAVTIGADGTAFIQGLIFGTYSVQEVRAPVGYEISNGEHIIKLTEQDETIELHVDNAKQYREVTVLKQSAGENPENLMGAVFALYTADGVFLEDATTGYDGKVSFTVPFGSYVIIETKAPEGYELSGSEPFAFTYDENTKEDEEFTYTFVNEKSVYSLEIYKHDANDEHIPLEGAEFAVTDSRQFTQIITTGADGKARIDDLVYDDYTIREVKAPKGYLPSEDVYTIDKEDLVHNNVVVIKVPNTYILGSVALRKIDHDDPEKTLEGAEFILKDELGNTLKWTIEGSVYTLSEDGTETISAGEVLLKDLPEGQYTLVETKAPEGYVVAEAERIFSITADDHEKVIGIEIENLLRRMTVGITKVDSENREIRLAGAEFTLYRREGNAETTVAQAVTNSNGIVTFTDLPMGSYRIRETKAPAGYKLWSNPIDFIVDGEGNVKVGSGGVLLPIVDNVCMATVTNTPSTKEIIVKKVSDDGTALAGAKFRITGNGKVYDVVTGADGTAKITLRNGDYVLEELVAPDGYILNKDKIVFKVGDNGLTVNGELQSGLVITMLNRPVTYCFQIHKRDANSGKDLSGATFTITGDDTSITVTTNASGIAGPITLRPGTYVITETVPPQGYTKPLSGWTLTIKNDGQMDIKGDNATVAVDCSGRIVTIGNNPPTTPPPGVTKTGQGDTTPMLLGGVALMLISVMGFIALAIVKRREEQRLV
ncbi:MAG: hypothetical protein IKU25_03385 [Clostridia bacterium]|nr:hypothetical protein [Clostridia bacterium]